MTWFLRMNDVVPNGTDQIAVLIDAYDDTVLDGQGQPVSQYNTALYYPLPLTVTPGQILIDAQAWAQKVKTQRAAINNAVTALGGKGKTVALS